MRKLMTICAMAGALAGLGFADSWTGSLEDAHCAGRQSTEACQARRSSSSFMLNVNGTRYKLDGRTNTDVRSAIREDRHFRKDMPVTATITGYVRGNGRIHASTVAIQQ